MATCQGPCRRRLCPSHACQQWGSSIPDLSAFAEVRAYPWLRTVGEIAFHAPVGVQCSDCRYENVREAFKAIPRDPPHDPIEAAIWETRNFDSSGTMLPGWSALWVRAAKAQGRQPGAVRCWIRFPGIGPEDPWAAVDPPVFTPGPNLWTLWYESGDYDSRSYMSMRDDGMVLGTTSTTRSHLFRSDTIDTRMDWRPMSFSEGGRWYDLAIRALSGRTARLRGLTGTALDSFQQRRIASVQPRDIFQATIAPDFYYLRYKE